MFGRDLPPRRAHGRQRVRLRRHLGELAEAPGGPDRSGQGNPGRNVPHPGQPREGDALHAGCEGVGRNGREGSHLPVGKRSTITPTASSRGPEKGRGWEPEVSSPAWREPVWRGRSCREEPSPVWGAWSGASAAEVEDSSSGTRGSASRPLPRGPVDKQRGHGRGNRAVPRGSPRTRTTSDSRTGPPRADSTPWPWSGRPSPARRGGAP